MAFDQLIFTRDDVREIRKASVNIDDFPQYAREVQMNYLEKILGDKLYAALQADLLLGIPQSPRFIDLIDGIDYVNGKTIIFRGVKIYCSYLWLHLYAAMSGINHTPIGNRLFKDEEAEDRESSSAFRTAAAHYIGMADGMEEGILNFLRYHQADYPEFSESYQTEPAEAANITFKVVGSSYNFPESFL